MKVPFQVANFDQFKNATIDIYRLEVVKDAYQSQLPPKFIRIAIGVEAFTSAVKGAKLSGFLSSETTVVCYITKDIDIQVGDQVDLNGSRYDVISPISQVGDLTRLQLRIVT